jgi:prolipoprotein diacylglyceryl transferase
MRHPIDAGHRLVTMPSTTDIQLLASIPSPSVSSFQLGPLTIHFYALCILVGIIVALWLTDRRLRARGTQDWQIVDVAVWAIPLAIVCARVYHVLSHFGDYFGPGRNPWNITEYGSVWAIWEGGIAIFGALLGGALGVFIGCRQTGLRFTAVADALAPGLILAQACGRFGNWFNQELFGRPTTVPWGLEIAAGNPAIPAGTPAGTLFHPTFLYEVLWNALGVVVLLWLGRRIYFQWGRLFAVYLIWYGAGRTVWENIRIDPSQFYLGIRTNVWAALGAIALGLIILAVQARRHNGPEPSPYLPGRAPAAGQD